MAGDGDRVAADGDRVEADGDRVEAARGSDGGLGVADVASEAAVGVLGPESHNATDVLARAAAALAGDGDRVAGDGDRVAGDGDRVAAALAGDGDRVAGDGGLGVAGVASEAAVGVLGPESHNAADV